MSLSPNRRRFLQLGSAASLGYLFTGPAFSVARAQGANGRLKVAGIGVGGKGRSDIKQAGDFMEVVGLCDIDESDKHLGGAAKLFPKADTFTDYRKMLEKIGNFLVFRKRRGNKLRQGFGIIGRNVRMSQRRTPDAWMRCRGEPAFARNAQTFLL